MVFGSFYGINPFPERYPNVSSVHRPDPIRIEDAGRGSKRTRRVRSAVRKRGRRGSGRTKRIENRAENGCFQDCDTKKMGVEQHLKRHRERKNRNWKPYSQQTWEERLEREQVEEQRALQRAEREGHASNHSAARRGKRKRNSEIEMPKAPRNTTQSLLHVSSYDQEADSSLRQIPSLQGLLSRETIRLRFLDDSKPNSDDEGPEESRGGQANSLETISEENAEAMNSPPYSSVGSVGSPCQDLSDYIFTNGSTADGNDKDDTIKQLQLENERLRSRLERLERELEDRLRPRPT